MKQSSWDWMTLIRTLSLSLNLSHSAEKLLIRRVRGQKKVLELFKTTVPEAHWTTQALTRQSPYTVLCKPAVYCKQNITASDVTAEPRVQTHKPRAVGHTGVSCFIHAAQTPTCLAASLCVKVWLSNLDTTPQLPAYSAPRNVCGPFPHDLMRWYHTHHHHHLCHDSQNWPLLLTNQKWTSSLIYSISIFIFLSTYIWFQVSMH